MERHSRATDPVRQDIHDLLATFQSQGLFGSDLDLDFEAAYLLALLDGLGVDAFISPTTYGTQSFATFVSVHLDRLFTSHPPSTGASK